jgi:PhnB protein
VASNVDDLEEVSTMTVRLSPYLSFSDNAREAMEFYHSVFGGELTLSTFAEFQASEDPAEQDKIMHGMLVADGDLVLMSSDTPNSMEYTPAAGFSVSLSGDDDATLRGYWDALSGSGSVAMPLEQAPWGDTFGMCVDRFGIAWMVNIQRAQP